MLVIARTKSAEIDPVRWQHRDIPINFQCTFELCRGLIAFRGDFNDQPDLLATTERDTDSTPDIIGHGGFSAVVEQPRQRHIKGNTDNRQVRSETCNWKLDLTFYLKPKLLRLKEKSSKQHACG